MVNESSVRSVFESSLKLKALESCLVVTDTVKEPIARQFHEFALRITRDARIVVMEPVKEHGAEPSREVSGLMGRFDVQVLITDKSLSHTKARRSASERGARIASMPTITEEIANRCLDIDYEELRRQCRKLHAVLARSKSLRITTELGTELTAATVKEETGGGAEIFGENGGVFDYKGAFGNLPEGEISFWPKDADGIYVVDATFPGLGLLETPLVFRVKNGRVFSIEGKGSDDVKARLDSAGEKAYLIAEVGIGTNPKAEITGSVLEDEKALGTVHIALGNNLSYGGGNDVPLHLDGVIRDPDIFADKKQIMKKGKPLW
ncbi:aminopeptidase [Candidatus Omnitrophota bacterium]